MRSCSPSSLPALLPSSELLSVLLQAARETICAATIMPPSQAGAGAPVSQSESSGGLVRRSSGYSSSANAPIPHGRSYLHFGSNQAKPPVKRAAPSEEQQSDSAIAGTSGISSAENNLSDIIGSFTAEREEIRDGMTFLSCYLDCDRPADGGVLSTTDTQARPALPRFRCYAARQARRAKSSRAPTLPLAAHRSRCHRRRQAHRATSHVSCRSSSRRTSRRRDASSLLSASMDLRPTETRADLVALAQQRQHRPSLARHRAHPSATRGPRTWIRRSVTPRSAPRS